MRNVGPTWKSGKGKANPVPGGRGRVENRSATGKERQRDIELGSAEKRSGSLQRNRGRAWGGAGREREESQVLTHSHQWPLLHVKASPHLHCPHFLTGFSKRVNNAFLPVHLTGKKSGPGEEIAGNAAVKEISMCKGPEAGGVCREESSAAGMKESSVRQAWRAEDQGAHVKDWCFGGKGQIHDVRVPLFPLSVHFWHGLLHSLQV